MKSLIDALQFLTIVRLRGDGDFSPARMVPYFPIVGLGIGLCLALMDRVALAVWSPGTAAAAELVFLIGITGALHLDGLGDTADGLYGFRSRERALAIMKDSRMGAMGLVAVVAALILKWAGLAGMENDRALCLIVIPALSRGSMLFGINYLGYCRGRDGTGAGFFESPITWKAFWGLAPIGLLTLVLGTRGLVLLLVFAVTTTLLIRYYHRKLGCITGDMLGAMTEASEAMLFMAAAAQF
jgi:adenosylcobinamide-GDP ribazoletransferase